jgi:hypothetical protein
MAKKSKKKNSTLGLILNIAIIVLGILTLCTLFMPVIGAKTLAPKITENILGSDVVATAFSSELSSEMSAGTLLLYGLKSGDSTAFVTNIFCWGYIITLCVACASVVFAVLNLIGLKFKLVNKVIGIVLIAIALVTFIFGLIVMSKFTNVTEILGKEIGTKGTVAFGLICMITALIGGGVQTYNSMRK